MPEALVRLDRDVAGRAASVLQGIIDAAPGKPLSGEILTRLKGLPTMLRVSGLPATLAFFAAKSDSDQLGRAYELVGRAMRTEVRAYLPGPETDTILGLISRLSAVETPLSDVAAASARVDALATWLRRLSEAVEKEQRAARTEGGGNA